MKLYHGAPTNFDSFRQEFSRSPNDYYGGGLAYLTTSFDVATTYAKAGLKRQTGAGTDPIVYTVEANFKKTFDVDSVIKGEDLLDFIPKGKVDEFARGAGLIKFSDSPYEVKARLLGGRIELTGDQIFKGLDKALGGSSKVRDYLIKMGYDSLRYNGGANMSMATRHDVYIAYKASTLRIVDKTPLELTFKSFMKKAA